MHIILFILKILGILLLAVLGILFFLLLLILFVPVRYSVEGKMEKDFQFEFQGKIHWLLHFLSFRFSWLEDGFSGTFRILGIRMRQKKERTKDLEEEIGNHLDEGLEEAEEVEEAESSEEPELTALELSDPIEESKTDIVEPSGQNSKNRESPYERKKGRKKNFFQKLTNAWEAIRHTVLRFCDAVRNFKIKFQEVKEILSDEANQRVVKKAFGELKYLFRHFKFRKIYTNLTFSFGDPAVTGQVLGLLCMIPVLYRYDFHLYPDFESENLYAEGRFQFSGKIRLIHLLVVVFRMIANHDVREFGKKILKH